MSYCSQGNNPLMLGLMILGFGYAFDSSHPSRSLSIEDDFDPAEGDVPEDTF